MTRFTTRVLDRFFTPRLPEPYAGPARRWLLWLLFAAVMAVFPGLAVVSALVGLGDVLAGRAVDPLGDYSLTSSVVSVIFSALPISMVWGSLRLTGDRLPRLGLMPRPMGLHASTFGWAFVWIFAFGGLLEYLAGFALSRVPDVDRFSAHVDVGTHVSFARLAAVGIPAAIGAGLVEEIVVLGFAYRVLERLGIRDGVIVAALTALRLSYHVYYGVTTVVLLPWAFVSVVFYRRYRVLWPLIVAHATWDTYAILSSDSTAAWLTGLAIILLAVTAAAVLALLRWRVARRRPLLTLAVPRPRPQWVPVRSPWPAGYAADGPPPGPR